MDFYHIHSRRKNYFTLGKERKGGQAVHWRELQNTKMKLPTSCSTYQQCPPNLEVKISGIPLNDRPTNASFERDLTKIIYMYVSKPLYLGRNSVTIERLGGRVTAPMKRTTFGWRNLRIMRTWHAEPMVLGQWFGPNF